MRATLFLIGAALAGCSAQESSNKAQPEQVQANSAAAEPAQPPRPQQGQAAPPQGMAPLTADGWGPLRIGMTLDEVTEALGPNSDPQSVGGAEPEACQEYRPARAPEGLFVMIQEGRLTRISLGDQSPVRSDAGLGLGATAADVRRAYGDRVVASRHVYDDPPAEYLTVWTRNAPPAGREGTEDPNARGLVYETDNSRRVTRISGGGPSIQYVEGCS